MRIYAIDPGPTRSALVIIETTPALRLESAATGLNPAILSDLGVLALKNATIPEPGRLVVEMIASYGMAVGAEVFETCVWIGQFMYAWTSIDDTPVSRLTRITVKNAICHSSRAKDPQVRQALIDRFGGPDAIHRGGLLYGVKGDQWAALAVAVAYADLSQTGDGLYVFPNARL